jgi:PhoD-like phosphatase
MTQLVLGPVLRHVAASSATIWVETDGPCTVEILGRRASTFAVCDHHYALVVVRDLPRDSIIPYEVALNGVRAWPQSDEYPPSVIRTNAGSWPVRIVVGSCRAAAPHERPYTLERDRDPDARGADSLWLVAMAMTALPPHEWPDLALFLGDQVYADDSSPGANERIERRRDRSPDGEWPPDAVVADYEEYTWLYREAWSQSAERWFLSVVPSAMIFDDHDMIDDWNISDQWVRDIRREPWWRDHVLGGLMSYWVYQHLGNLSPDEIEEDGLLATLVAAGDATELMEQWAFDSERSTPLPGGYRFSHSRAIGDVRLVVVDSRNGRVLEPGNRMMVDDGEWEWVAEQCRTPCEHLLVASSLPVFLPDGVHGLQTWNEVLCDGRWGRWVAGRSERLRRRLDLEDWSAFDRSFRAMCDLLGEIATARDAPTVTVLGGDIHCGYVADVELYMEGDGSERPTVIQQVVSSPMRNALVTAERGMMRFATGRVAASVGRLLGRSARRGRWRHHVELLDGPVFNNNIVQLELRSSGDRRIELLRSVNVDDDPQLEEVCDLVLRAHQTG